MTSDARKRAQEKASTPDDREGLVGALTGMAVRVQVPNAGTMSGFLRRESAEELASVLPIVTTPAEHDRQVAVKALRDAAKAFGPNHGVRQWLRDRAERIEGGGEDA